ncbi:34950_t:CDS:2, partial [Racocetra persica]
IPPNCQEPFLNLIKTQSELKKFEPKYFSTTSFTPLLQHKMLQLDQLPNLRKFIEKAKYLRYIEIVRSDVKKQKDSEREIIDFCHVRNIKCSLKYQLERYKDYICTYEINFESYIRTEE